MAATPEIFINYEVNSNSLINSTTGTTTGVVAPSIFKDNLYTFNMQFFTLFPAKFDLSGATTFNLGIGELGKADVLVSANNASFDTSNAASGNITATVNTTSVALSANLGSLDLKDYSTEIRSDSSSIVGIFTTVINNTVFGS